MDMLSLEEAAARIDVSTSMLRTQARKGVLKAEKQGGAWFVSAEEVDRYAREHRGKRGRPKARYYRLPKDGGLPGTGGTR